MAHHSSILFPDAFTLLVAIDYLAMVIIGGMGSILGSIFGAIFMTLLPEVLKLGATSLTGVYPQRLRAHRLDAGHRLRARGHPLPDVRAQGLARIWLRIKSYWKLWPYCVLSERTGAKVSVRILTEGGCYERMYGSLVPLLVFGLVRRRSSALPRRDAPGTIKLGNLVDLTGPTSDQGKDIAQGRIDAVQYFNEQGGINGKKIELVSVEYGFQPPRAVAAYKKFVEDDKVLLVLGYGTPDTEALRPLHHQGQDALSLRIVLRPPHRPAADAVQLPRRDRLHEPDPHLPQLREGDLEGHEPQAAGGLHLRRQRLRAGADRGRARSTPRRSGWTWWTRRSSRPSSPTPRRSC